MEIKYTLPSDIEPFFVNMSEEATNILMNTLMQIAVRHRLIDYPSMEIETRLRSIEDTLNYLKNQLSISNRAQESYLASIDNKLSKGLSNIPISLDEDEVVECDSYDMSLDELDSKFNDDITF